MNNNVQVGGNKRCYGWAAAKFCYNDSVLSGSSKGVAFFKGLKALFVGYRISVIKNSEKQMPDQARVNKVCPKERVVMKKNQNGTKSNKISSTEERQDQYDKNMTGEHTKIIYDNDNHIGLKDTLKKTAAYSVEKSKDMYSEADKPENFKKNTYGLGVSPKMIAEEAKQVVDQKNNIKAFKELPFDPEQNREE